MQIFGKKVTIGSGKTTLIIRVIPIFCSNGHTNRQTKFYGVFVTVSFSERESNACILEDNLINRIKYCKCTISVIEISRIHDYHFLRDIPGMSFAIVRTPKK